MAVGFAITGEEGRDYNGKITSYLVSSCLVAAMGAFIFGYDIGVSGNIYYFKSISQIYKIYLLFWLIRWSDFYGSFSGKVFLQNIHKNERRHQD